MVPSSGKKLAVFTLLVGVLSLVMGAFFVAQGFSKSGLIAQAMASEKVTYGGADGTIAGVIDTPSEAGEMARILKEHRLTDYGYYTELKRDDPKRAGILSAMTMETALNLAQMGYGLAQVVEGTGAFMGLIGLTLVAGGVSGLRSGRKPGDPG